MSQFIHLSFKINMHGFLKIAAYILIRLENDYNHDYRFSEHLLKFNMRATYPKTFLNRLLVCIATNNRLLVIDKIKKPRLLPFGNSRLNGVKHFTEDIYY